MNSFKNVIIPTEFTYLSECALNLGVQIAKKSNATIDVVSVIEPNHNAFMEEGEAYSHDPTSSIKNIQITEEARARMHERAEEIAKWAPDQKVLPKVLYGNKTQSIQKEIRDHQIDLVIMGGDLYDQNDEKTNNLLYIADAPIVILKCMVNALDQFKDIIFLIDSDHDSFLLVDHLKSLQELLCAKIHLLRINTPKNFLSAKKCNESLEAYAAQHYMTNFTTVNLEAKTELEGLMAYCETIPNAFVALGVHKRSFMEKLITNRNKAEELIANSVHPVWTFRN